MTYKIEFTRSFQRDYLKLPQEVRKKVKEQIARLKEGNFKHPSLRIKKMHGKKPIWEASITMNYRMTFQIEEDILIFRTIGIHNILK